MQDSIKTNRFCGILPNFYKFSKVLQDFSLLCIDLDLFSICLRAALLWSGGDEEKKTRLNYNVNLYTAFDKNQQILWDTIRF